MSTSAFATSSPEVYYDFKIDWRSITHNAASPTVALRLITTCLDEALRIYGTQRQQIVSNRIRDNCPANPEQDLKLRNNGRQIRCRLDANLAARFYFNAKIRS